MSHPGLFSDIGSKTKNLLGDDYNYDTKVEVKASAEHGVNFTSSITRDHKKGTFLGILKSKFRPASWVGVDTTLDTAGKVQANATMDKFADGLKVTVESNFASSSSKASLEFLREHFTVAGSVELAATTKVTTSAVVGHGNIAVGAEVVDFDVSQIKLAGQYKASSFIVSGKAAKQFNDLTIGYTHFANKDVSVAAELTHDVAKKSQTFELGALYQIDKSTKLRSKIDSNGVVSVSYGQDLRPGLALKVSGQIETQNLNKVSKPIGISLVADL